MIPPIRHRTAAFLTDLFSCFLIPAGTLLFAGGRRWLSTNFSALAVTGEDCYRGFFFWGLMTGGYFLLTLLDVSRTLPSTRTRVCLRGLSLAAAACLCGALVVPYLPGSRPPQAELHILLAFSSCVLLMAALLPPLLALQRRTLLAGWWAIAGGSAALFALCGMVSSSLEIFFTLSVSLLVRSLWHSCRPTNGS